MMTLVLCRAALEACRLAGQLPTYRYIALSHVRQQPHTFSHRAVLFNEVQLLMTSHTCKMRIYRMQGLVFMATCRCCVWLCETPWT